MIVALEGVYRDRQNKLAGEVLRVVLRVCRFLMIEPEEEEEEKVEVGAAMVPPQHQDYDTNRDSSMASYVDLTLHINILGRVGG